MISAKEAYDLVNYNALVKASIIKINDSIQLHAELGMGFCRYSGVIYPEVMSMLTELGYTVELVTTGMNQIYLIKFAKPTVFLATQT
jgi:hypothetical protein